MKKNTLIAGWNAYVNYVRNIILPNADDQFKNVAYWRNEIFCSILTFIAPLCIIALVPSIYAAFVNAVFFVAYADILAFALIILIITKRSFSLKTRKYIFIFIGYYLSIILLNNISRSGPGLLFLLVTSIFAVIISAYTAYYAAFANTFICSVFAVLIYFKIHIPITANYDTISWIAISSNLIFLSFICAVCLNLLMKGLENSLNEKNFLAANLSATVENTVAQIFSIDRDFRYITFNQVLRKYIEKIYSVNIKLGNSVFDFMEVAAPEEAKYWKRIYTQVLTGKALRFDKDFNVNGHHGINAYSINPIIEDNHVVGLSCFVVDITELKKAEAALAKSEAFNRGVLSALSAHIAVINQTGLIVATNKAWDDFALKNGVTALERTGTGSNYFDVCQKAAAMGDVFSADVLQGMLLVLYKKKTDFYIEYPCNSNGEELWFALRAVYFESVEPMIVVAHQNITERKKAQLALEQLNISLEQKVTERTAALESSNKELEAFTYSVSHDLRAPLRIINGYCEILINEYNDVLDDEAKRLIDIIINSAKRMGMLIDDMLQLSRVGKKELNIREVNMNKIVDTILAEKKILFESNNAPEIVTGQLDPATCDVSLIQQVWFNLISNAIKYSSKNEKPVIEIGSYSSNSEVVYFVKDNGVGFDMEYADKLFGVFQRLHKANEFEGTGVGLSIVHRIITKHGGKIWAESKINKGATFYFSLPSQLT